ncbi:MAG: glycosyltransferase family 2 protein [Coxiellaceae bacterium]|nr:glycosyltransferase family 2 protein [Coxiellaceae bacterium]
MPANKPILSVSIVVYRPDIDMLYKTTSHLDAAVACLGLSYRVALTIIDNGHTKSWQRSIEQRISADAHPHLDISYLALPENPGYGAGNNKAIMASSAEYHLVLNPDAFLAKDCLQQALDYLQQHPKCLLLAPSVTYENGERQYLCRKNLSPLTQFLRSFAPGPLKKCFHKRLHSDEYRDHNYEQPMHNVEFMTGCFMLLQTQAAKDVGGFDDRYIMYVEDADLTRRLLKLGDNIYLPTAQIVHAWTKLSSNKLKYRWMHSMSCLRYWWKFRDGLH